MKEFNDPLRNDTPLREKTSVDDVESEKTKFSFDIRQKHPESKEHYREVDRIQREAKNPFLDLDGKEVIYNGEKIGVLNVRDDVFPQCVFLPDGASDCGWFYQIQVEVSAKNLDVEAAKRLVLETIGKGRRIDFLEVNEDSK